MSNAALFTPAWINWIGENHLLGVPDTQILDILVSQGFDHRAAREQVARAAGNSYLESVEKVTGRLRKLETLMDVYAELWTRRKDGRTIDRVSGLSSEAFFRWYYSLNQPVVLTGAMQGWRALQKWKPQYFRDRYGAELVEVMVGRNSDAAYEINCERHRARMAMDRFVEMVLRAGTTNDFYMVANNHSIESGNMRALLKDIALFDGILDRASSASRLFLWFGPAGTVTPLHCDTMNVLLAQVLGRKKVTLIPSFQSHLVYNSVGVYSEVDCESPDFDKYPLFRKVTPVEVELGPGEALFIPVGWWHHVRSLDISISVSFTNFASPNTYSLQ